MSEKRTIVGYRVKDVADDRVPYAVAGNFGPGWDWRTRNTKIAATMSRAVAHATMGKMLTWAEDPANNARRTWNADDLRLVRVVRRRKA